jgi:hypothetical protein
MKFKDYIKTFIYVTLILSMAFLGGMDNFVTLALSQPSIPSRLSTGVSPAVDHRENQTQATQELMVELLSSTDNGLSFDVTVPWTQLSVEPVVIDQKTYLKVSIPDWPMTSQPGMPEIPFHSDIIGVPFDVDVNIEVIPGKFRTYPLSTPLLPAITQKTDDIPAGIQGQIELPRVSYHYDENPAVYVDGGVYPNTLAEVTNDGLLRQQRLVGLGIYPVQYHPEKQELIIYESLQVNLTFSGLGTNLNQASAEESSFFENLLQGEVLNYETAIGWRQSKFSPEMQNTSPSETYDGPLVRNGVIPWSPPEPAFRIKVREDGMYKLTYQELTDAGLPVTSIDPRTFQLYSLGEEVAIHVVGQADGVFNQDDYLLFYGQKIESKYTLDNVYWLTYGQGLGLRMGSQDGSPGGFTTPAFYQASRYFEENNYYFTTLPDGLYPNQWLWDYIYPSTDPQYDQPRWAHDFSLSAPYPNPASIHLSILGNSVTDHHIKIYLNTIEVGDVQWYGRMWQNLELPVTQGILKAGLNTIEVISQIDPASGSHIVYVDWFELVYPNTFTAENNRLDFTYALLGTWDFHINGFTTNDVAVFNISNPKNVNLINNLSVSPSGSGFSVQFKASISGVSQFWAGTNSGYHQVEAIEADVASNLGASSNGADHIVITHQAFKTQAETLRDFRASQGLRAVSIDVQDIYDQFNYGIIAPEPIRDFLAYTYSTWESPAPSFVVLFGDGHYDPKDYLGFGRTSFIPPYLLPVDPWIDETAADNRYVTFVGQDTLPDMMIGRISVNTSSEANAFINKIIAYEQSPISGSWQQKVLAVADNADTGGNFPYLSNTVLDCCLTYPYTADKVYYGVTHTTVDGARNAVMTGINTGKLLVNYYGHGSTTGWASESLFTTSSVASLQNGGKLPVVLAMTCLEGYFINPQPYGSNREALSEVVTRADGKGAVASWSPTGQGVASGHIHLSRGFYNSFFSNLEDNLGTATLAGKINLWNVMPGSDLLDTYTLFGDPAMNLARPIKAMHDSYEVDEDEPLIVAVPGVLSNDIDAEGKQLTAIKVSDPENGSLTLNSNGSFTYIPNPNYFGVDQFTYKAYNGELFSNVATVQITIHPINDPPVAVDDSYSVSQNFTLFVSAPGVLKNDYDVDGDPLTAVLVSNPTNGSLLLNANGSFRYTPDSGFHGVENFTYKANDGQADSNIATVTITVIPVNQPPIVSGIPDQTIYKGQSFTTINLDSYVSDPDNTADQMTWTYSGNTQLGVSIDTNRVATITVPNPDWIGSENITFRATDPGGLWDEDTASFTVTSKLSATVQLSNLNQTYDGTPKPVSVTTDPPDLIVSVTYDGSTHAPTNAGSYAVVATVVDPSYQGSANGTLIINPRPITVTADDKTKLFGDPDPILTYQITDGELVSLDQFSGSLTREEGEDVGSYAIQQGSLSLSANYALNFIEGELTITDKPIITITVDPGQTKVYGEDDPAVFTYTYSPDDPQINFTGALSRVTGEAVGSYAYTLGTLSAGDGYTIDLVSAYFNITPRPITVTADPKSKAVGEPDPPLTYQITSGTLVFGDTLSGSLERDPGESVGTYSIRQGSLSAGNNYNLGFINGIFTITGGSGFSIFLPLILK